MKHSGRVHVLPADVDTDQIIPAEHLTTVPEDELGDYALAGYEGDLTGDLREGDIIVAGPNFGMGSSREAAPVALRQAGIGAIVAESFARIFYRNAINVGLPIAEAPGIIDHVTAGDRLEVDVASGTVNNVSTAATIDATPLPPDLLEILEAGGLVAARSQGD